MFFSYLEYPNAVHTQLEKECHGQRSNTEHHLIHPFVHPSLYPSNVSEHRNSPLNFEPFSAPPPPFSCPVPKPSTNPPPNCFSPCTRGVQDLGQNSLPHVLAITNTSGMQRHYLPPCNMFGPGAGRIQMGLNRTANMFPWGAPRGGRNRYPDPIQGFDTWRGASRGGLLSLTGCTVSDFCFLCI